MPKSKLCTRLRRKPIRRKTIRRSLRKAPRRYSGVIGDLCPLDYSVLDQGFGKSDISDAKKRDCFRNCDYTELTKDKDLKRRCESVSLMSADKSRYPITESGWPTDNHLREVTDKISAPKDGKGRTITGAVTKAAGKVLTAVGLPDVFSLKKENDSLKVAIAALQAKIGADESAGEKEHHITH